MDIDRFVHRHIFRKKPWFRVVATSEADDPSVAMEFDWNAAFIEKLKKLGINGRTEEDMVDTFMANILPSRVYDAFGGNTEVMDSLVSGGGSFESEAGNIDTRNLHRG